jgi:pimeloyl-ACP methyl ester carboxylesterase
MNHAHRYLARQDHHAMRHGARQWGSMLPGAAAALAAMALFVQYRARRAERENPPQGRFVDIDGVRLHYVDSGQGRPLVLLHGNGTMAKDFDISGVPGLAAENYRVIAFDRPGYGYSERPRGRAWTAAEQAELLARALQRLGIDQPIVLGHSWGTLVAVTLALNHPEQVRSLVLLSGYYYPTPRLDVVLLSPPAIPVLGDLMRYTVSPLIGRAIWPAMLRKIFAPAKIPERFARLFPVWMALRPSQLRASAMETALMIPEAAMLSKRYRELQDMPVVIMAGADDLHVTAQRHSVRLHRELPRSELLLAPGVGHMVHHAVPEQVMTAIDMAARGKIGFADR